LLINGRDQTNLLVGVERQIAYVRAALRDGGEPDVELRGALCFPDVGVLPLRQLSLRGIVIEGPKPASQLAARRGSLRAEDIDRICRTPARRSRPHLQGGRHGKQAGRSPSAARRGCRGACRRLGGSRTRGRAHDSVPPTTGLRYPLARP
jgi:hypothetical protein